MSDIDRRLKKECPEKLRKLYSENKEIRREQSTIRKERDRYRAALLKIIDKTLVWSEYEDIDDLQHIASKALEDKNI